jgi:hypothetical protein
MELKTLIAETLREYLNEQQPPQETKKYIGDTYEIQDNTAEITVHEHREWGLGMVYRYRVENAGDILRELSSRGINPDIKYINEKVKSLEKWMDAWLEDYFIKIPYEIDTLEKFMNTNLRVTHATDGREYVARFHPEILEKITNEYENIPVYSKETKLAKDLVLSLLYGDKIEFKKNLGRIKKLSKRIERDGYITFTPL